MRLLSYIAALFVLLTVTAFAQDTAPTTVINLGDLIAPWLEYLVGIVVVLIGALVTWITTMVKAKTGYDIEAHHREAFQTALTNAAGLVIQRGGELAAGVNIDVKNPAIRDAIMYVNDAAPDAVKYFGVTPNAIAEKLNAKLGVVTGPTAITVNNTTAPLK